jgi:hypothetical protein
LKASASGPAIVPVTEKVAGLGGDISAGAGLKPEGSMRRHDWIFDVLRDLQDYALANGLSDLATSIETALTTARGETADAEGAVAPMLHRPERTH